MNSQSTASTIILWIAIGLLVIGVIVLLVVVWNDNNSDNDNNNNNPSSGSSGSSTSETSCDKPRDFWDEGYKNGYRDSLKNSGTEYFDISDAHKLKHGGGKYQEVLFPSEKGSFVTLEGSFHTVDADSGFDSGENKSGKKTEQVEKKSAEGESSHFESSSLVSDTKQEAKAVRAQENKPEFGNYAQKDANSEISDIDSGFSASTEFKITPDLPKIDSAKGVKSAPSAPRHSITHKNPKILEAIKDPKIQLEAFKEETTSIEETSGETMESDFSDPTEKSSVGKKEKQQRGKAQNKKK